MWALAVGVAGFLTVAIAGTVAVRRSKTPAEQMFLFNKYDTISWCCLYYLCFYVLPGILAVLDVIPDPIPGLGMAAIIQGVAGVLIVAIAGAVAIRRTMTPAERRLLVRRIFYFGLLLVVFFVLPGILAVLDVIPGPIPGLGMAVAILVYYFLEMWWLRQSEQIREAEKASVGSP